MSVVIIMSIIIKHHVLTLHNAGSNVIEYRAECYKVYCPVLLHAIPHPLSSITVCLKVRPYYATWWNATKCGLVAWLMARIMWTSMWHSLGRASACCGMPCGMKIRSAKCRSHQRFAARHMMSKGFQNFIS